MQSIERVRQSRAESESDQSKEWVRAVQSRAEKEQSRAESVSEQCRAESVCVCE